MEFWQRKTSIVIRPKTGACLMLKNISIIQVDDLFNGDCQFGVNDLDPQ